MKRLKELGSFVLFGLSAIAAIAFFYYNTRTVDLARHEKTMASLYELESLDSRLNEDALKIRAGTLRHYDSITRSSLRLRQVEAELQTLLPAGTSLDSILGALSADLEDKLSLMENMKSEGAELRNSLHYFQLGVKILAGSRVAKTIDHLAYDLLTVNAGVADESLKQSLPKRLREMRKQRALVPSEQLVEFDSMLSHGNVILENNELLDDYLQQIISHATDRKIASLREVYTRAFAQSERRAGIFRSLLVAFTALMLAYLGFTMWRLKAAHELQKQASARLEFQQFALDQHAIVSMADAQGRITYANQKFCDISGYTLQELLGNNHRILKSGQHPDSYYAEMWRTVSKGKVWEGDVCNRAKDGRLYWVHSTVVPFLDTGGEPWQYISIRTDITAVKKAESQMAENRQFLHSITNAMGEGVYALDTQGDLTFMNRKAEEMLGWSQQELLGRNIHDMVHSTQADGKHMPFEECPARKSILLGETFHSAEETFTTRNGEHFPVAMVASPLISNGIASGSVAVFRDIREQKRTHEELKQARDQALEASRLKSEFLSTMSHEIRTPMNGVIGMTELLLDTPLDTQQHEFAGIIKDSAVSLLGIINDILDFSKIEAGKLEIENIEFTLLPVVESILEILAGKAREKGLILMSHVDPAIPANVMGDPGRLRQILLNLAGNAVKFTPSGEVVVRVMPLGKAGERHRLRFEVTDTGIGMSPETAARLFQPFTQADGSVTRKYGGTGLGLSICKRLTELMGGTIGVESEAGHGSRFWLEIPMAEGAHRALPRTARDFSGTGVLLVAASRTQREILFDYLKTWGIHAAGARNGDEALQLMQKDNAFNVAIIAGNLPDIDADTLLNKLREFSRTIKFILLADSDAAREQATERGFKGALLQPVRQSSLLDTMMHCMDRRELDIPVAEERRIKPRMIVDTALAIENHTLILLVEDNTVNQKVAINILNRLGYAAQIANNGQEAVDMLDQLPYGLVLMDCQMPVMDGFDAARAIRNLEKDTRKHIPIIAMTANAMQGDRERCLEAGMDDYVSKPIEPKTLSAVLAKWLPNEEPPAMPDTAGDAVIDMRRMSDLFGDDVEIIRELLSVFLSTTGPLLDKLKIAIDNADYDKIKSIGHQVAGSAANLGIPQLQMQGRAIEQAAAESDIGQASTVHASMLVSIHQVADFVKNNLG